MTGDAVAITSALQLHSLLATDDEMVEKISPTGSSSINCRRAHGSEDFRRVARER
ncbi:scarecrow-like protein 3, partial [Trifolium medium]|nr:scarecrow-like protein 3 [Trifolium medium]